MKRLTLHDEDRAAREGCALVDASLREVLSIRGEDRLRFLQGMLTQDVEGLPVGATAYTALLTPKGGLVTDGELTRLEDQLLLDLEPGQGSRVKGALEAFLVADDVEVADVTERWAVAELWGPRASALCPEGGATRLGALQGVRRLLPREHWASSWAAWTNAGATPVGFEAREMWRVEAGWARWGLDMVEGALLLEVGLERAVSYTKGCYVGQEVVARTTYRGHVNWKLGGLDLGPEGASPGEAVTCDDKPVGNVTSVARSVALGRTLALARLHRDVLEPGRVVTVAGRSARVAALPFGSL